MGSVFGSVLSKAVGDSCVYYLESKQSQLARSQNNPNWPEFSQPIIDHEVAKKLSDDLWEIQTQWGEGDSPPIQGTCRT